MPYYKSATGKEVVIKLGKRKKELRISPKPQYYQQENLHILFPRHITKIGNNNEVVKKEIVEVPQPHQFIHPIRKKDLESYIQNQVEWQTHQPYESNLLYLKNSLPTGSWKDQRCFIIGGGFSLKDFDFSQLQGEKVIAINKSFVDAPFADIQFSVDKRFYDWITKPMENEKKMKEARDMWPYFKGHKVWLKVPGQIYQKGIEYVEKNPHHEGISMSLEEGIYASSNSGYAAINLAIALGANPIYLLGYDMKQGKRGESHYHGGYPAKQTDKQLEMFAKSFPKLAKDAEKAGVKIINLNRDSALRCFEFADIEEIIKVKEWNYTHKWRVISFYTTGTGYEEEIKSLEESLIRFGVDYHFFPCEPKGSWRENLNYKSWCISEAFNMFPDQDIVFIDADGIMRKYPILFDKLSETKEYDVAATFHKYAPRSGDADELLSGTLWFPNNQKGKDLVDAWHKVGLENPNIRHQKCLRHAIDGLQNNGYNINVYRMPFEYTYVFDYRYPVKRQPIIEHFQASRRFRTQVGFGSNLIHHGEPEPDPIIDLVQIADLKSMTVSVVVVSYRRLDTLEEVLSAWLKETPDVWLCDCSKEGFQTNLPIKIVRAVPDPGNKIRHAVATMTCGDLVIKADDDVMPQPGIVKDFINCYHKVGECIMGIHGRIFYGEDYYNETEMFTARTRTEPFKVDFLGVVTCSPRKYLAMDLKDCASPIEDLYWHNYQYYSVPKYVIVSKNYTSMPASKDSERLCASSFARKMRQDFYKKCYEEYYKK